VAPRGGRSADAEARAGYFLYEIYHHISDASLIGPPMRSAAALL
jgi:hypothetical protein